MIDFREQPGGGPGQDPAPTPKAIIPTPVPAVDTANHFLVGAQGETLVILNPPGRPITRREALNLAAWLVVLADVVQPDPDGKEFARLVAEIRKN